MSENDLDKFENAYRLNGVVACKALCELQRAGAHDMRLKLREKEITHEAIVELDERVAKLEAQIQGLIDHIRGVR